MRNLDHVKGTVSLAASGSTGVVAILTEYYSLIMMGLTIFFGCVGWYYKHKESKRKDRHEADKKL